MKVLHINQSDISGGAAIAGYSLHRGLLAQNVDSRLLVGVVKTGGGRVAEIRRNNLLERFLGRLSNSLGLNYLNHISSFDIPKHEFYQEADILNLHNLHNGYFNYLTLSKLTKNKPAIFTLHDMWSFTGHCAYSYDCDRWKNGCGKCPYPDAYPAVWRDSTRWEWKLKNWVYSHSNLSIVTPSKWLTDRVKQSMLNCFNIYHIPNGIDTEAYQPIETEKCRFILDIPKNKQVLMFGADNLQDPRKGGSLLIKALSNLPQSLKAETVLLIFGNGGVTIAEEVGIETINLGYIGSDRLKSIAYSAADLFIFPSLADNLPIVLQESLACGTPMVSFKVGGIPEIVRHDVTGYLALREDPQDLCQGIIQLLEDKQLRLSMSENSRAIALEEYDLTLQVQRYINLYDRALKN